MKKSIFTSILIIFVTLTLVIVTPLDSIADTYLDSESAFSLSTGYVNTVQIQDVHSMYYSNIYQYNENSNWSQAINFSTSSSMTYQLPSPFVNQNYYSVTSKNSTTLSGVTNYRSLVGFGFNLSIFDIIDSFNLQQGDYFCFAIPFMSNVAISNISISFGTLVTGSAYESSGFFIDDRFLCYNPHNVSGMDTSGIIDTTLWSTPASTYYYTVVYCNIPFSEIQTYRSLFPSNSSAIILSVNWGNSSAFTRYWEPIIYSCSVDEISVLNNISDNVQIIADTLQQGSYTPPPDTSDIDDIIQHGGGRLDEHLYMHVGEVDTVYRGLDFTSISSGLAWYADTLATIYARLTFLKGIYGVIILFMIFNLLKGGALQKVNDKEEEKPVTKRIYEGK